ncbi:hypothetical protein DPMN_076853 [Dreissena polymorpha]|uniref:Uncharacterized protein n=1 Tax=Dreissena polymorpha TaxID=45954 RepID=A0A9D3YJE7_DREPO|nr:hypothetical protein DPMN_076853 [Dreissena polymorpha]
MNNTITTTVTKPPPSPRPSPPISPPPSRPSPPPSSPPAPPPSSPPPPPAKIKNLRGIRKRCTILLQQWNRIVIESHLTRTSN